MEFEYGILEWLNVHYTITGTCEAITENNTTGVHKVIVAIEVTTGHNIWVIVIMGGTTQIDAIDRIIGILTNTANMWPIGRWIDSQIIEGIGG